MPTYTPVTPDPVGPALAVAPNPTGTSVLLGGDNGLVLFSATGGR